MRALSRLAWNEFYTLSPLGPTLSKAIMGPLTQAKPHFNVGEFVRFFSQRLNYIPSVLANSSLSETSANEPQWVERL